MRPGAISFAPAPAFLRQSAPTFSSQVVECHSNAFDRKVQAAKVSRALQISTKLAL
jgi:hypothetical protein